MAPAFIAREVIGTSPCAVIKMIGNGDIGFCQLFLKFETVHSGKAHVEHQATRSVGTRRLPKCLRRVKYFGLQTNRFEQIADGVANRGIVINNEDSGAGVSHRSLVDELEV